MPELAVKFAFAILGALLIALNIPLARRKIAPNQWYGFRTPKTLSSPEIWYPVNEYAARRGIYLGAAIIIACLLSFLFAPSLTTFTVTQAAITLIGLAIILLGSLRQIRKLSISKQGAN